MQKRYLRGQVWHWNDPVYGDKKDGKWVDQDEVTIRYSRYVVIMQDTDTISKSCIIVPCSTQSDGTSTDVEFCIYDDRPSYAKPHLMTPVSTYNLDNYICTLSDEDMDRISSMVGYVLGLSEKPEAEPLTTPETHVVEQDETSAESGRHKWDKSAMKAFIEDVDNHGVQYASLMYTLSEKSARKYYSNFKLKLAELQK